MDTTRVSSTKQMRFVLGHVESLQNSSLGFRPCSWLNKYRLPLLITSVGLIFGFGFGSGSCYNARSTANEAERRARAYNVEIPETIRKNPQEYLQRPRTGESINYDYLLGARDIYTDIAKGRWKNSLKIIETRKSKLKEGEREF